MEQLREFLIHRSAYQLKEADPHSWAIPRLSGPPKAALVEVQADEYGGGRPERVHARLFADAMEAAGLDSSYGAYLDRIPGVTLATVNLMSMCGLNRRLLGAIVGHLALFEMTSSIPNRRYAAGIRRLGLGERATEFFDEHVLADAVHENIAAVDLAGGLARQDPSAGPRSSGELARSVELDAALGALRARRLGERAQLPAGRSRGARRVAVLERARGAKAGPACGFRRRAGGCGTCRSDRARRPRARPGSPRRPGPGGGPARARAAARRDRE